MKYKGDDKMTLAERMVMYRAKHKLTQREMGRLIDESLNMVFKCEKGVNLHTVNRLRLEMKLKELEEQENA